jgi:hypothetical protein
MGRREEVMVMEDVKVVLMVHREVVVAISFKVARVAPPAMGETVLLGMISPMMCLATVCSVLVLDVPIMLGADT